MKPWGLPSVLNLKNVEDLARWMDSFNTNMFQALNGKIGFTDNIDCQVLTGVNLTPNQTTISHSLNKVPIGFLVINANAAANVYSGTFAWTKSNIYLAASATVTASLVILGG